MKKAYILVSMIALLLLINLGNLSAYNFDNSKITNSWKGGGYEVGTTQLDYNKLWEKYKPIKIDNLYGFGKNLFSGAITEHSESCSVDCFTIMEIYTSGDEAVVDNVIFKTLNEDGSWTNQDIRSYQFYYKSGDTKIDVDDYETQCTDKGTSPNGTKIQECNRVKVGTHKEDAPEWTALSLGEVLPQGTYTIKLEGEKKPSRTVDWIIETNGEVLNEWAVWGPEAYIYQAHGESMSLESSGNTAKGGIKIFMNKDAYLLNFTSVYSHSTPATKGYVLDSSMTGIGENVATLSSGVAIFTERVLLEAGQVYYLVIDKEGGVYDNQRSTSTLNISGDAFEIIAGRNAAGDSDITTQLWDVVNVWMLEPQGLITLNSPADASTSDTNLVTFNFNATANVTGGASIVNMSLWTNESGDWELKNTTITTGTENTTTWNRTITDGIIWNVQACDSDGDCGFAASNYSLSIDTEAPTIVVNAGNGTQNYGSLSTNHTLNYTITNSNLAVCWVDYNGANRTIPCTSGILNTTNFTLQSGTYSATIYANDTVGNLGSNSFSWSYKLLELDDYYNQSTISGATNPFNITLYSNAQITSAYLNYNGTNYLGSISSSGDNYTLSRNQIAPIVTTSTNIPFFWVLGRSDAFEYNTTSTNQSVTPIVINTTCGAGMYLIQNFTIVNELTQDKLNATENSTELRIDLSLYTQDRTLRLTHFYSNFTGTNPVAICIDNNLSGSESYSLDIQAQYEANDYSTEVYHIEKYILNSTSLNQNTTLYDLPDANTQNFKIVARDSSYLPLEGALIQIERKYIDDGTFKITEIPKTDEKGITSASLEVNDVIYNFYVYQNGSLISSFTNVLAICQTPLVSTCLIELNAFATSVDFPDYDSGDDFNFSLDYNKTSRIVLTTFTIPSGEPAEIKLKIIREDTLGTVVNSTTLTSASGTISVLIPSSFGNSTVLAVVYKSDIEQGRGNIKLDQNSSDIFGAILIILALLVTMTLIGMAISNNPIISAAFLFVGVILLYGMNLISNTGFVGATATILFLGIAIILIIIKAARRT